MANEAVPSQAELSPEDRALLIGIRAEFQSLLSDYIDDIPEYTASGPCIFKCQTGWFSMMYGRVKLASVNIPKSIQGNQLSHSLERAIKFIGAYTDRNVNTRRCGEIYSTTTQDIEGANLVIGKIIQEIDSILSLPPE